VVAVLVFYAMQRMRSGEQTPPQPVDLDWDATQDALARGSKIEAIKIYRDTGDTRQTL
jgi:hypothetical protein